MDAITRSDLSPIRFSARGRRRALGQESNVIFIQLSKHGKPSSMNRAIVSSSVCLSAALMLCSLCAIVSRLYAQDRNIRMHIVYPPAAFTSQGALTSNTGGFIIDVTKPPYNARGDGTTDNTAAFKAVLNDLRDFLASNGGKHSFSIYLRSGTYLVSDRLVCDGVVRAPGFRYFRLIGEDRTNTVIKLKDNCPGFGAGAQKEVIACYKREDSHVGGQMWGNEIRNVTINTGKGNPGAIGVVFLGANACSIDNLTIRSGDGQGWCGLFLPDWSQQGHFSDITIEGFDCGIRTQAVAETNPVFEHITLKNQNIVGFTVDRSAPCIRKLKSINTVEAVRVDGDGAHCVLLDSDLSGGNSTTPAIRLVKSATQQLFTRNIAVSGYGASINVDGANVLTGRVDEWLSGRVFRFDSTTPARTLNLPIEDAPLVSWESDTAKWADPDAYAGSDAQKLQAALNSGKTAVCLRRYFFTAQDVILTIPASVKQIDFMNSESWIWGGFRVAEASSTPLFVEHTTRKPIFRIAARRTLVARYGSLDLRIETAEPVTVHLQNIAVLANAYRDDFCPPNAVIYARNINEESWTATNFAVNGGKLWVMGFKTESDQTAFHAKNGGFLEVLGGYVNFAGQSTTQRPDVINDNANVSYIGTNYMSRTHWEGIWEIRGGVTRKFVNDSFPDRITGTANNYFVPLYVGYNPGLTGSAAVSRTRARAGGVLRAVAGGVLMRATNAAPAAIFLTDARGRAAGTCAGKPGGEVFVPLCAGIYCARMVDATRAITKLVVVK